MYKNSLVFALIVCFYSAASSQTVIQGNVGDIRGGESLPGVNILVENTFRGTATDTAGHFAISLPAGKQTLLFRHIGYHPVDTTITVEEDSDSRIYIYLQPKVGTFNEVLVEEARYNRDPISANYRLTGNDIKNVPMVLEPDPIKALYVLPGVVNTNDMRADLNVRGHSSADNLILIDGLEVYNPYHLLSITSSLNSFAIRDLNFYAGSTPLSAGDRVGSMLEVSSGEERSTDDRFMRGFLSLMSVNGAINSQFGDFELFLAGRRVLYDLFFLPYGFIDSNIHLNYYLKPGQLLRYVGYYSNDFLKNPGIDTAQPEQGYGVLGGTQNWGNNAHGIQYTYETDHLRLHSQLAYSNYFVDFQELVHNNLTDYSSKFDLELKSSQSHHISLGTFWKQRDFLYDWQVGSRDQRELLFSDLINGYQHSELQRKFGAYVQDDIELNSQWKARVGGKWVRYDQSNYFQWRLGTAYILSEHMTIRWDGFQSHQFIHHAREEATLKSVHVYFPTDEPEQARGAEIGIDLQLRDGFNLMLATYFKQLVGKYIPEKDRYLQFNRVNGRIYGIDVFILHKIGGFKTQFSYSYIKSQKKLNESLYPFDWDVPHTLSLLTGFEYKNEWFVNLIFALRSGTPFTPVIGINTLPDPTVDQFDQSSQYQIFGEDNSFRYPYKIRTDLSFRKVKETKYGLTYIPYLQVSNILGLLGFEFFNQRQTSDLFLEESTQEKATYYTYHNEDTYETFPFLMTIGVEFEF